MGLDLGSRSTAATDLGTRLALSARHVPAPATRVVEWMAQRQRQQPFHVHRAPFSSLSGWNFLPESGDLGHQSGRFFVVRGLHVTTNHGPVSEWWQPIIHQEDVAILGVLAREIDGVLHFLMQAKMEPGNVNTVQLSPTVQATSSNYSRAHRGAHCRYLEYFTEPGKGRVLVDILQSEQGSWFWGKRNRNIVVEATEDVEPHDDFVWLTLGQIYALLYHENLVNMDTRSALACLPPHLLTTAVTAEEDEFRAAIRRSDVPGDDSAPHSDDQVRSWVVERKAVYTLATEPVALNSVRGWHHDAHDIHHEQRRYFTVHGVDVVASNREVRSWTQPILAPCGLGIVAFVVRRWRGVLQVLARADLRPGYRDVVEVGPTVQCTPGNFTEARRPEYLDLILSSSVRVRYDVLQSEEGGRFYHAVTRHMIVEVAPDFPEPASPDFLWLTIAQLNGLMQSSYQVNIEARSLLLCLRSMY